VLVHDYPQWLYYEELADMATLKQKKPDYWNKAKRHLAKVDKTLAPILNAYKGETLASRGSAFYSLARAIVGQQISVKAADSVWRKLEAGVGGDVSPQAILDTDTIALRACGLSGQKVIYMKELSQFFATRGRVQWHRKSDEQVMADLVAIKGIGKWSAEMFLIFHLMRSDVFPIGDLGLRKAIERHYNGGKAMLPAIMHKLAESWRPYRTVATWYLWRSLDPVPVEY
jgi:DNA-3-methyladenine glycosylase II